MSNAYKKMPFDAGVIRTLRKRRGWTQDELASRIGVTRQTVHTIESGSSTSIKTYQKLCDALGVERLDRLPEHEVDQYDVSAAIKSIYKQLDDQEMRCFAGDKELSETTRRELMVKLSEAMMLCVL